MDQIRIYLKRYFTVVAILVALAGITIGALIGVLFWELC